MQFAHLCGDPSLLGVALLNFVSEQALPADTEVELMIRAHYCFVLADASELITALLQLVRVKVLDYVNKRRFRLLVRLLVRMESYAEMEYVLDLLLAHDQVWCRGLASSVGVECWCQGLVSRVGALD